MKLAEPVLVSMCLLGINCRYNQTSKRNPKVIEAIKGKVVVPICPEALSGLPCPRAPAEIDRGDGFSVLAGKAKVLSKDGKDWTKQFIFGAREALRLARLLEVKSAILKDRSPSCGVNYVYNQGKLVKGVGIFTALLIKEKVVILCEKDFED